ncbi:hypothetical protein P8452_07872 [Trifolium repens]|nr:hypothetical protein P8452_07872 [Trifolium repens]
MTKIYTQRARIKHGFIGSEYCKMTTLAYKTEATDLQRQLRHLQSQLDMLSSQVSTLTQGSLSGRNLQMNAVLGRIASTSEELAHYHSGDVLGNERSNDNLLGLHSALVV